MAPKKVTGNRNTLNEHGAALLTLWREGKTVRVMRTLSVMPPLAAAYVASYITQYLYEDGEHDGEDTSDSFLDELSRAFNVT